MTAQSASDFTPNERRQVKAILNRILELTRFLSETQIPTEPDARFMYTYLARMKQIQGNTDNGVSLIACLMAKEYLCRRWEMAAFDIGLKPQGAPGLDIDERTTTGLRVVGEVKTTVPYQGPRDLGSAQKAAFEKDFQKLNTTEAAHRFFFVTERSTFDVIRARYASRIPGVEVVLLPEGDSFVCSPA
jgi:hypothetical protein